MTSTFRLAFLAFFAALAASGQAPDPREIPVPPIETSLGALPGVDGMATGMMKNMIKKKGVASIEELRELALDADVKLIACQMTMDLFEYKREDMIDGPEIGGAATYMEVASKSDINLYI